MDIAPNRENDRSGEIRRAMRDVLEGVSDHEFWWTLAWLDLRQRYRRSVLGPLWLTFSMGVSIAAIGTVWVWLFRFAPAEMIPRLCLGIIIWTTFMVGLVTEGCQSFMSYAEHIKQVPKPFFSYICVKIAKHVLVFFHYIIVYVVVMIIYGIVPNQNFFYLILTFPLLVFALSWVAFLLAVLAVRYRDLPDITANLLTVLFFVTPIVWSPEQLGSKAHFAQFNPLTHLVDLLRAPLLGESPGMITLAVGAAIAIAGWGTTILVFAASRRRIAYWL